MKNINERFKELIKKVKSEDFYNNRGLANEVPFYIFDYDPKDELIVRENIRNYFLKEVAKSEKLKAIEIDLFDLLLESLKNDGIFDLVFQMEERRGSQVLYEKLKNSFNIEVILEYIKEKLFPFDHNRIAAKRFEKVEAKTAGNWELLQLADVCATSAFISSVKYFIPNFSITSFFLYKCSSNAFA